MADSAGLVVIPRACPGSGKTTYVKKHYPTAVMASADHFFDKLGRFDFRLLGKAHKECWDVFYDALNKCKPLIVVDNTNIKVRDFSKYVIEARKRGYDVEIVRLECDPDVAAKRGVHSVPKDIVHRMAKELAESKLPEDFPVEKVVRTDQDDKVA